MSSANKKNDDAKPSSSVESSIFPKISHLIMNLPPGPPLIPMRYIINF
jgi:hypothetical protein